MDDAAALRLAAGITLARRGVALQAAKSQRQSVGGHTAATLISRHPNLRLIA